MTTTPTRTYWTTANEAFSNQERNAFNRYRFELWQAADRLRSALPIGGLNDDSHQRDQLRKRANELHDLICKMPFLEG